MSDKRTNTQLCNADYENTSIINGLNDEIDCLRVQMAELTKERDALKVLTDKEICVDCLTDHDKVIETTRQETAREIIILIDNRSWFDGPSAYLCAIADIKAKYHLEDL